MIKKKTIKIKFYLLTLYTNLTKKINHLNQLVFLGYLKKIIKKISYKTANLYRRPMSDISHLSLILIIFLTLISGAMIPLNRATKGLARPLELQKAVESNYISSQEQRILEADSVATVSAIYSDSLGDDASQKAEELNNKIAISAGGSDYLSAKPIVGMVSEGESRNTVTKYVVKNGETLWSIAGDFNITTETIRYANKLEDENSVKPGQTLLILPVVGVLHTVANGESLAGIASRYKSSEALITAQNDLYGEELTIGRQLVVPDGEIPSQPKPAPVVAPKTTTRGVVGNSSARYGSGNFRFPTIVGSSGYYNGYHWWAIDIPNRIGTPIFAADSGRIVEARYGWNGGYGNTVLIDHGNGFRTRYAHLSSIYIIGGYVSKGQVIGGMGSTGRSTGSHLHFEIILNGSQQNPLRYL